MYQKPSDRAHVVVFYFPKRREVVLRLLIVGKFVVLAEL